MTNQTDKRKTQRFDCYVPVDGKEGAAFSHTKTFDLSSNGIGFISDHAIALNERVAIELALKPDTEPVLVIGEVKWVRKITDSEQYRIGLTFADVIDGSREDIDQTLNTRFLHREMNG
ncbi:MAG: PilZ domain-containing protein [Candidatus Omnitrophica bacterium]|nr:PilZ domain-containing protein [Candidatus Omnitrophota bacterium]